MVHPAGRAAAAAKELAIERVLDRAALVNPVVAVEAPARRRRRAPDDRGDGRRLALGRAGRPSRAQRPFRRRSPRFRTSCPNSRRRRRTGRASPPHLHPACARLRLAARRAPEPGRGFQVRRPAAPRTAAPPTSASRSCARRRRSANSIAWEPSQSQRAEPIGWSVSAGVAAALAYGWKRRAGAAAMKRGHRATVLASVAPGELTASDAFAETFDEARRLDLTRPSRVAVGGASRGAGRKPERRDRPSGASTTGCPSPTSSACGRETRS